MLLKAHVHLITCVGGKNIEVYCPGKCKKKTQFGLQWIMCHCIKTRFFSSFHICSLRLQQCKCHIHSLLNNNKLMTLESSSNFPNTFRSHSKGFFFPTVNNVKPLQILKREKNLSNLTSGETLQTMAYIRID